MSSGLTPAGSSTYSSNTMYVGDGTWDTQRNTFLLPNLVGLNFDTMRYNGMGNRFAELPQYHILIRGHGVIAAITFLFIVPFAILVKRFGPNIRLSTRVHIWLQVLTVLLTTVIFVLGWFAVGPNRSLTNPHHGIGLAIYVLVLVQFIGGWWVHSRQRKHRSLSEPIKAMLHHWLGRAIALLGLVQIPLGLTLYGSPKALFVLYTLAVVALVIIYFISSYRQDQRGGSDYDSRYSYGPGSAVDERRRHGGGIGGIVKAGAVGVGLAALANRFRRRSRSTGRPEVIGSRRHSGSYVEEEKYSRHGRDHERDSSWTDRLLKIAAVVGAAGLVKSLLDRRRNRDRDSDVGDYGPPLGGSAPLRPDPLDRVDDRRPLPSSQHPLNRPLGHRRSESDITYSSYTDDEERERKGHGLRDAVAGLGAVGLIRNIMNKRRDRREEQRREREMEEERRRRANDQRLTGDGFPRRGGRRGSRTATSDFTSTTDDDHPRHDSGLPPPFPAGAYPPPAPGAPAIGAPIPGPPLGANPPPSTAPLNMPPIPPDPQGLFHPESSGSEAYVSAGGRQHRRHSGRQAAAAAAAGAAAGVAAAEASSSRRDRHHESAGEGSPASQPVSVKVKMHSDGRHVTLRRLPEEEAAAQREARRRSRDRKGGRRRSRSSLSGTEGGSDRWRRAEAREQEQAAAMRIESDRLAAAKAQNLSIPLPPPHQGNPYAQPPPIAGGNYPPPPPIPTGSGGPRPGPSSVGSPGTYDGTNTETSDYANNRRRRRAERAQAKAREARAGNNVEFVE